MVDNLARFARLSAAAKERERVRREAESRAEAERWTREEAEAEQRSRQTPEYLAGPPGGCHTCYAWQRHVMGGWYWIHQVAIDPVERPFSLWEDPEPPFLCEYCTHDCHGPDGLPLPLIAYA